MNTIGEKIKYFRKEKGLSQEDLAHELDITVLSYSKIERNITDVTLTRLTQIANFYKISVIDILSVGKETKNLVEQIEDLNKVIAEKNKEIIDLQKEVIRLFGKKTSKKAK